MLLWKLLYERDLGTISQESYDIPKVTFMLILEGTERDLGMIAPLEFQIKRGTVHFNSRSQ